MAPLPPDRLDDSQPMTLGEVTQAWLEDIERSRNIEGQYVRLQEWMLKECQAQ